MKNKKEEVISLINNVQDILNTWTVKTWNKRYESSIYGIQVALWLGINAEPDDKYAIITRDKKKEFFNNQKNVLFACKTTGLTNQMADDIIVLLNSSET
jgi:hypothetical protein